MPDPLVLMYRTAFAVAVPMVVIDFVLIGIEIRDWVIRPIRRRIERWRQGITGRDKTSK